MWKIITHNGKLLIAALAIMLAVSAGTLLAEYEPKENLQTFYREQGSTEEVAAVYHERMNELFNAKIELLINEDVEEGAVRADNNAPENEDSCTPNNVSTFCVASQAVNEYFAFQEVMLEKLEAVELAEAVAGKNISALSGLEAERKQFINEELDVGLQALDVTVAAYSELHRAYPLHKKYQEIIGQLEKYRDMLSDVRHEVTFFPMKFIDVSTTQCQ